MGVESSLVAAEAMENVLRSGLRSWRRLADPGFMFGDRLRRCRELPALISAPAMMVEGAPHFLASG